MNAGCVQFIFETFYHSVFALSEAGFKDNHLRLKKVHILTSPKG